MWVSQCISSCYQLAGKPLPLNVKVHCTSEQVESSAYFRNVSLSENCKTDTWSNPLTQLKIMHLTWQLSQIPISGQQYFNLCLTNTAEIPHSSCSGKILLPSHDSGTHPDIYVKKKEQLTTIQSLWLFEMLWSVWFPWSVPTFLSPQQHWLWTRKELRKGCSCPVFYTLIWEYEEAQSTCMFKKTFIYCLPP